MHLDQLTFLDPSTEVSQWKFSLNINVASLEECRSFILAKVLSQNCDDLRVIERTVSCCLLSDNLD